MDSRLARRKEIVMRRAFHWAVAVASALVIQGGAASAQFYYPPGYGGAGWGGWGGGGETVAGSNARGLGVLAAGAGVYNQQTAQANAINTQTAMQWNEYIWESQQLTNARYAERMAAQRAQVNTTASATQKRLRDNPTESDIMRGDALNVALDEITNPKVYVKALSGASTKFAGNMIRELPFQYASAALTTSFDDLTQNGPPELLKSSEFDADRTALRELRPKLREQAESGEKIDPALIAQAKKLIKSMDATLKGNPDKFTRGSNDFRAADNFLKAAYGLVTMLESPAIDVLLSGVENRPNTTVGDLLGFMNAFNLRFGNAKTPAQRMAYSNLYPVLDSLRDQVAQAGLEPTTAISKKNTQHPVKFFQGMDYSHLDAKRGVPPAPAPAKP
jgi:hypothetical protein